MTSQPPAPNALPPEPDASDNASAAIQEPRLWSDGHWTARVHKNNDDDGWAVSMTLAGHDEPALVGPWTMGRDKKNPKPLDGNAFRTLVKTAFEVLRRHEQQRDAQLHPSVVLSLPEGRLTVQMDITPDEVEPSASLSACNALGEELARVPVAPNFKLNHASASAWVAGGFQKWPR